MQRRIGLAQALINDPEFLILDEPTSGLDPIGTRQVKDLIVHLGARGKTILLSSHLLSDVEDVVDRMVILYGGKVRASGTCDELLAARDRSVIETGVLDEATIAELRAMLMRRTGETPLIHSGRQRLEDLFLQIVARARAERAETSGAQHGGATAAFLVGDGSSTARRDGSDLIEALVSKASTQLPERDLDVEAAPAKAAQERVIDALLVDQDVPPAPVPKAKPASGATRAPREQVDDDVIAALLGGKKGDSKDAPEERTP
jgi:ABC-2 type transport system ATP-binding protein